MKMIECGTLVVGGGAAGMCAALRAKALTEAPVVLLEARDTLGGNSSFAPIPDLLLHDISEEAAEQRYLRIMEDCHWKSDARIVSTVSRKAPQVVRWLHELIAGKDGSLTERLEQCCRACGVEIYTNTRATELLRDDRGWHCGALAMGPEGVVEVRSSCVILACGGFLGAPDLMEQYFPLYDADTPREVVMEGIPATGDGVRMALAAGAGDDCTASFEVSPNRIPFWTCSAGKTVSALVDPAVTPQGLWVNNVGVRFVNEAEPQSYQAVYRQPNKEFHVIFDRGILELLADKNPALNLEELDREMPMLMDADAAIVTENLGELTAWIRGKTHIVYHTIERYNECCGAGRDFLFGKPSAYLLPFRKPPFYGFRLGLALRSTHGPVRTNPMMAVVDRFDAPVPALIACGADVAGMYPGGFVDGTDSILWTITTGCMAGEHAAGFARGMGPAAPCNFPKFTARQILAGEYYNVGTEPKEFAVMGGIRELQEDGSCVVTHKAVSPDKQGLLRDGPPIGH